jgi:hypothetical protein
MVKLTKPQIHRELNNLRNNYDCLLIKTIPYEIEKAKLEKMLKEIDGMSEKQLIKLEQQKKPQKKSTIAHVFSSRGGNGIKDEGQVIVGEDTDEYVRP